MKEHNLLKSIKDYTIITIGVILVAFGIQYFYAPNDIAGGGLSGLALIINHYAPSLSVGTIIFLGNIILFVISFILIGGEMNEVQSWRFSRIISLCVYAKYTTPTHSLWLLQQHSRSNIVATSHASVATTATTSSACSEHRKTLLSECDRPARSGLFTKRLS